jgi:K+-sensing histidine kinase KdpD
MRTHAHQDSDFLASARRNLGPNGANPGRLSRPWTIAAMSRRLRDSSALQYFAALAIFITVSLLCPLLEKLIGYQANALVYLLAVVLLALFVDRGPIIFGTTLTALGWVFLAPPRYSFHLYSFYDKMMVVTYFVVALTIGQLMSRLRAHQEAEIKARLLAESERLSRTLLNSVSHELRTPIAAITTATSELHNSGTLSPRQQLLASEIESASIRLNGVVKSLLNAARLQSGQVRPKMDWCDVSDLVRVTLDDMKNQTSGHLIEQRIAPGMALVKLDFVLMQQALANLLANAVMHTPAGTEVEISARIEADTLILEVADSGPGLPPDQLERIFDAFHRTPVARPGGTGLGLTIVKGFVEAQGGQVRAANRPEGGAIFSIRMPMTGAPELPEEPV